MVRWFRNILGVTLMSAAVLSAGPGAADGISGQEAGRTSDSSFAVLLPPANLTPFPEATGKVIAALQQVAARHGIAIMTPHEVRPLLRKYRIRAVGVIDKVGAQHIVDELRTEYCLLVTIDFYSSGAPPAVGVSLRLLRLSDLRVVWAKSVSANGEQYVSWLGKGEVIDIDSLILQVAEDAITDMDQFRRNGLVVNADNRPLIAIVPFDDLGNDAHAAAILNGYLVSTLVSASAQVVEPGMVQGVFRRAGRWPRGEIDFELMSILRNSLAVDLIITGTVDDFQTDAVGQSAHVSVGARLLDTHTRKIIATAEVERTDRRQAGVLHTGHGHAGGIVMKQAAAAIINNPTIKSVSLMAQEEKIK